MHWPSFFAGIGALTVATLVCWATDNLMPVMPRPWIAYGSAVLTTSMGFVAGRLWQRGF